MKSKTLDLSKVMYQDLVRIISIIITFDSATIVVTITNHLVYSLPLIPLQSIDSLPSTKYPKFFISNSTNLSKESSTEWLEYPTIMKQSPKQATI